MITILGFAFVGFETFDSVMAVTKNRYHQINGKTVWNKIFYISILILFGIGFFIFSIFFLDLYTISFIPGVFFCFLFLQELIHYFFHLFLAFILIFTIKFYIKFSIQTQFICKVIIFCRFPSFYEFES